MQLVGSQVFFLKADNIQCNIPSLWCGAILVVEQKTVAFHYILFHINLQLAMCSSFRFFRCANDIEKILHFSTCTPLWWMFKFTKWGYSILVLILKGGFHTYAHVQLGGPFIAIVCICNRMAARAIKLALFHSYFQSFHKFGILWKWKWN